MSKRPELVTVADMVRWSESLDNDARLANVKGIPALREVCFAGMYLSEELEKLDCPADLIVRIQYTAGVMSFGRDTWEVATMLLTKFKDQTLEFELDPTEILN